VDTSKDRPKEEIVEDAVLYHNRRSTMGDGGMTRSLEGIIGRQERIKG